MAKRRAKRKQGRPRKLDDKARRKRLLDTLLRTGSYAKAVKSAGITFQGFRDSIKRDDQLRAAVEEIEQRAIFGAKDCLHGSVHTDPLIALRFLAVREPETYSKQTKHLHKHGHIHLTIEQQQSAIAAIASELGISGVIEEAPQGKTSGGTETDGGGSGNEGEGGAGEDAAGTDAPPSGLPGADVP